MTEAGFATRSSSLQRRNHSEEKLWVFFLSRLMQSSTQMVLVTTSIALCAEAGGTQGFCLGDFILATPSAPYAVTYFSLAWEKTQLEQQPITSEGVEELKFLH